MAQAPTKDKSKRARPDKDLTIKLRTRTIAEKRRLERAADGDRNSLNGWALRILLEAAAAAEVESADRKAVLAESGAAA
jgi:hypothetical protein